ncbi:MAG: FAD-dependent oxidoreductase [Candidatus Hydrogenedentes bacterium]|nr:FAD-dependent oxidoreductase [Candidatus Hydrogenedentota bacterium]
MKRMRRWVMEPERRVPVAAEYDVLVVGGGIAGVAAALSAARLGARVGVIEKEYSLGGLATLGNVVVYLPLCDGMGRQVIRGLGEELLKLSIRDGYEQIPACWRRGGDKAERLRRRYRVNFNPASFILALEARVLRAGVRLHYDTRFCDVVKRNGRIEAVVVENKGGRAALACRAVVDASGDADVCARAGEPTVSLATNVRAGWFFYSEEGELKLEPLYTPFDPTGQRVPGGGRGYAGDDPDDVTQHMIDTRALTRRRLDEFRRASGTDKVYPVVLPTIPSFRMTRRLAGAVELNEADERRVFEDSIGMTGDWRKPGPVYYIPLRALTGVATANLIAAGRCMSSGTAWDVTRAIPTCAVTGQAAGAAAALAARMRTPRFSELDVGLLQGELAGQKVLLKKRVPPLE